MLSLYFKSIGLLVALLLLCCLSVSGIKQSASSQLKEKDLNRNARQGSDVRRQEAAAYTSEIFYNYGNEDAMSLEDFDALLAHVGLKKMTRFANDSTHDHHAGEHHDHDHGDHEGHDHDDHEGQGHDGHEGHDHEGHDHEGHDHEGDEGHDHDDHEGHDHGDHEDHDHKRKRRDATDWHAGHQHNHSGIECITSTTLLADHGLGDAEDLIPSDFLFLCPSLMYMLDTGACAVDDGDHGRAHGSEDEGSESVTGLVWLYTMVSVLIISLCALFGILCIPRRGGNENLIMQFLIALAMGSMSGDGMLHLIPHSMVPDHHHSDDHSQGHGGEEGVDHTDGLYKGLVALIGVYSFFFMERGFAIMRTRKEAKEEKRRSGAGVPMMGMNGDSTNHGDAHGHSHEGMFSCTSLAMVIIVGDMFHNFCDGLAIGAAFAGSLSVGISTSIAVFCHELPHEIGDFAVLITSGMSAKRAVGFNLLSTVPCFVGAAIGLELGSLGDLSLWIFAFVGGLFMYIALVDLVPEMTRPYGNPDAPWVCYLALHSCGIFLGVLVMVILGIYEEDLQRIMT